MESDKLLTYITTVHELAAAQRAHIAEAAGRAAVLQSQEPEELEGEATSLLREAAGLVDSIFAAPESDVLGPVVDDETEDDRTIESYRTRQVALSTGSVTVSHSRTVFKSDKLTENSYTLWIDDPTEEPPIFGEDDSYYEHTLRVASIYDYKPEVRLKTPENIAALQDSVQTLRVVAKAAGVIEE